MKFRGCLYSSGTVRQLDRKGKPWQAILRYKDADGTWRSATKVLDATGKRDAEGQLVEWQRQMEESSAVTGIRNAKEAQHRGVRQTVTEVIIEYLDYQRALGEITDQTYSNNVAQVRDAIAPYLGDIRFDQLTTAQVREWLRLLKEERHYKFATIENYYSPLRKTYHHYALEGRIAKDPTRSIRIRDTELHEKNVLTRDGKVRFLELLDDSHLSQSKKTLGKLALFTGMRTQELCGLRWSAVNMVTRTIRVVSVIGEAKSGDRAYQCVEKRPKERASRRVIPMLPQVVRILGEQREYQLAEYRKSHPGAESLPVSHYVCGEGDGSDFMAPSRASSAFYEWAKRSGVVGTTGKPVTLHDLRHTFATDAVASHMDVKSISSVIGHANASITLDVYARADEDAVRVGMRKLGEYLDDRGEEAGRIEL